MHSVASTQWTRSFGAEPVDDALRVKLMGTFSKRADVWRGKGFGADCADVFVGHTRRPASASLDCESDSASVDQSLASILQLFFSAQESEFSFHLHVFLPYFLPVVDEKLVVLSEACVLGL